MNPFERDRDARYWKKKGEEHYVKTYHRPIEVEHVLAGTTRHEKANFLRGALDDMNHGPHGIGNGDIIKIILMMFEDLENETKLL